MATDFLLDMLVCMQDSCDDDVWPVKSFVGDFTDVTGGASLNFEARVDDVNHADLSHIKRLFFTSLHMLHHETRSVPFPVLSMATLRQWGKTLRAFV